MVLDHSMIEHVEEIAISKFKATCLAVLDRVRSTRKAVLITRFGEPVAEVVPPSPPPRRDAWIGCMASTGVIKGDITGPVTDEAEWEVMRE